MEDERTGEDDDNHTKAGIDHREADPTLWFMSSHIISVAKTCPN